MDGTKWKICASPRAIKPLPLHTTEHKDQTLLPCSQFLYGDFSRLPATRGRGGLSEGRSGSWLKPALPTWQPYHPNFENWRPLSNYIFLGVIWICCQIAKKGRRLENDLLTSKWPSSPNLTTDSDCLRKTVVGKEPSFFPNSGVKTIKILGGN